MRFKIAAVPYRAVSFCSFFKSGCFLVWSGIYACFHSQSSGLGFLFEFGFVILHDLIDRDWTYYGETWLSAYLPR